MIFSPQIFDNRKSFSTRQCLKLFFMGAKDCEQIEYLYSNFVYSVSDYPVYCINCALILCVEKQR